MPNFVFFANQIINTSTIDFLFTSDFVDIPNKGYVIAIYKLGDNPSVLLNEGYAKKKDRDKRFVSLRKFLTGK